MHVLRQDVDHLEAVLPEQVADRCDGKIEGVLIVDLVIGSLLHDVAEVRVLEHQHALGFQQNADAFGHRMQVGNVAHHVGAKERIGLPMLGDDAPRQVFIEELGNGADALGARHVGHVGRRLDAEVQDARLGEVLHHDAVVAADFDHEGLVDSDIVLHHALGELFEMLCHA